MSNCKSYPFTTDCIRRWAIPIYPPNKKVKSFFNKIGETVEINNEKLSLNFWTMSSMMAPYYEMLNYLASWLTKRGLNKKKLKII